MSTERLHSPSVRVVTYNAHGCVGTDGRRSVDRVADVLRACDADVIGVQEIDVGRERSGGVDQAEAIALRLGMTHVFGAALYDGRGRYGNAVLSRHGLEHVRTRKLPSWRLWSEPRCFVHARVDLPEGALDVIVTHFGLEPIERFGQALHVSHEAASASPCTVLLGDLNCGRGTFSYARIASRLQDAQHAVDPRAVRATYPAWRPMLRLDHVFVGDGLEVLDVLVPGSEAARIASDHLPVVVTLRRRRGAPSVEDECDGLRAQARLA